jgi:hypothetical protein
VLVPLASLAVLIGLYPSPLLTLLGRGVEVLGSGVFGGVR